MCNSVILYAAAVQTALSIDQTDYSSLVLKFQCAINLGDKDEGNQSDRSRIIDMPRGSSGRSNWLYTAFTVCIIITCAALTYIKVLASHPRFNQLSAVALLSECLEVFICTHICVGYVAMDGLAFIVMMIARAARQCGHRAGLS